MNSFSIISQNVSVVRQSAALLDGISFELPAGNHLLITGASGSGKTLLLQALAGKVFYHGNILFEKEEDFVQPKTVLVEQHYFFKNKSNTSNFYYQQRFNSVDAGDAETVLQVLEKIPLYNQKEAWKLLGNFEMDALKDAPLLQLSSGEHKRFQIIKALLSKPDVLLLDEPFMGLDISSRRYLNKILNLFAEKGCTIILVSSAKDAPDCVTHVLHLDNGRAASFSRKEEYATEYKTSAFVLPNVIDGIAPHFTTAVLMKNVTIKYGEKTILNNVNWKVNAGEKWLLKGPNGAGKSTLISLITGDNPQAFANDIYLFDRKKGSGESIWDIKKNIGYISPELQWHFDASTTCRQAVASGLFDTIGLFRKINNTQQEAVNLWLQQFDLETLADKLLYGLPVSKQKLVLLARAMVKNPPMLILDEPCQGLDDQQKINFIELVNQLCAGSRTLIYVSHYRSEVPDCIDHMIELHNGSATIHKHYQHTLAAC